MVFEGGKNMVESISNKMSNAEKLVRDYLTEFGIYWLYEHPVTIKDEKGLQRTYYPDFYLPTFGLYVEVCGADREEYKRRQDIYFKNNIPVIFVHTFKDEKDWKKHLIKNIVDKTLEKSELLQNLLVKNLFKL